MRTPGVRRTAGASTGRWVASGDFLLAPHAEQSVDFVVGNPPYIRFGNWPVHLREPALHLMTEAGLKPSKLTNAWVPFVVAATREEALEGTHGLTLGLPLADSTGEMGLGLRRMAQLGQGEPLDEGVEPSVHAAVQALAHPARGVL